MPLTDAQKFRGARGILGWTQDELASRAGITKNPICNFERGNREMMHNNKMACWKAFTDAGVLFNCDSIKFSPPPPETSSTSRQGERGQTKEETTTHD
jgi:DNA-binding XRE family transcriptional regulator